MHTAQEPVFPADQWLYSSPEEQGVDSMQMMSALAYLDRECYHRGIDEVVIVRNGYLLYAGDHVDSVHNIYSCSKTFTSTVLGVMIEDGMVALDDRASQYEPILSNQYPEVTLRHFTTMTSGYSAVGGSRWPDQTYSDWSWTVYEPDTPLFAAGQAYAYWDEAQMMFGRVLTQRLQTSMYQFLDEAIAQPIGMQWVWGTEKELDGIPINNGCTSVQVNALNFARWGWLFANGGKWDDEQVLPKSWVDQAGKVQVGLDLPVGDTDRSEVVGPGSYGYNWWVNGQLKNGSMKLPGAPNDCFFAVGFNNNRCFVLPSWKMVVIRMGEDGNIPDADEVYGTFLGMLGEAIR